MSRFISLITVIALCSVLFCAPMLIANQTAVTIHCQNTTSNPIGGAQVTILNQFGTPVATGYTNSEGNFGISLNDGEYTVVATYGSYNPVYGGLVLDAKGRPACCPELIMEFE